MNLITGEQLPPPPQPPQPHRCESHPDEHFTSFCPCCLCERLTVLDKSSSITAIKSLFTLSNNHGGPALRGKASSSSFLPELRRTKSFSGGKNEGGFLGFSGAFEPQRKSCDVRGRSTLFSLFQDNERHTTHVEQPSEVGYHVVEEGSFHDNGDEIQNLAETLVIEPINSSVNNNFGNSSGEQQQKVDLKSMKDHIDLDSQNKKVGSKDLKELAGSFWSAASVFRKKLRSWTRKNNNHKMKKQSDIVQVSGKKGNAGRNYRDTQSEIADYGFGRRSCDTDPRFSLDGGRFSVDAGRMSFDDGIGRCSFDEPRASWDGYLIGRTFPKMMPPMVSVVEDVPVTISRKDARIPVEEPTRSLVSINGDEPIPGGASQTKDYYSDSSSRRRRSLDRSSSIRKTAAEVIAEMKNGFDVKVPPPLNGSDDRDGRDLDSNSIRDDYSESFDLGLSNNCGRKGLKKSRRWSIWGLINRRGTSKDEDEDEDRATMANGVGRSYSESWHHLRRESYVDPRRPSLIRSNSSVNWRNSYGSFGSITKGSMDSNGSERKKDEFLLEKNTSGRYSLNQDADNGMLRFFRGNSGKPEPGYSHSFARSLLRLY